MRAQSAGRRRSLLGVDRAAHLPVPPAALPRPRPADSFAPLAPPLRRTRPTSKPRHLASVQQGSASEQCIRARLDQSQSNLKVGSEAGRLHPLPPLHCPTPLHPPRTATSPLLLHCSLRHRHQPTATSPRPPCPAGPRPALAPCWHTRALCVPSAACKGAVQELVPTSSSPCGAAPR
jgi:hypothetical protein